MKPLRLVTIFVCLLAASTTATAQERLTLVDATTQALAKNHRIRMEREEITAADARMESARGSYDATFRFDAGTGYYRHPITSLFSGAPEGDLAPSWGYFSGNASLTQLFKSGATVTFSTSLSREGTNDAFTLFDPAYFTSLGVDLRQPLLRNRAIDPARAALHVTALDRDRSGAALARQVLQTVAEVEKAYWGLVAARREVDVRRGNVMLAEEQRRDTSVRIEAKTVPVSDLAQPIAEVERRRGELFAAQEQAARAERALKQLIAEDARDPIWVRELAPADQPEASAIAVDVAAALDEAIKTRPELAELAAELSATGIDIDLARDSLKPRLDLVAGYTMRGLGGSQNERAFPLPGLPVTVPDQLTGGIGNAYQTLAQQKFPDATVGVTFELPIGRRAARGQLGAAEADRRRTTTAIAEMQARIAVEVSNAATALETASGRMQAARAGLSAAETQLRAEQDRFSVGATTNFFVLTRQNDLATAQLAEISALVDYRTALTELARAKGTLLRDRNIRVE
jgi:HAE1 family hydrophobic/amphiphilic exporter-1